MELKQCPVCHRKYLPVLSRRHPELPVQDEFPKAAEWQREQLISGICSDKCWETLFKEPDTLS